MLIHHRVIEPLLIYLLSSSAIVNKLLKNIILLFLSLRGKITIDYGVSVKNAEIDYLN